MDLQLIIFYQINGALCGKTVPAAHIIDGFLLLEVSSNIISLDNVVWFMLRQGQHKATYIFVSAILVACRRWMFSGITFQ